MAATACLTFKPRLWKRFLISPNYVRSFSALKLASKRSTTLADSAPVLNPSSTSATASSNVSRKSTTKNEKKAKKAPLPSDNTEAQLKQIESMMNMANTSNLFPTMDMWGTKLMTLDVEIPHEAPLRSLFSSPSRFWHATLHNFSNWLKNTFSMYTIARARAFTGVDSDSNLRFSHLFLPRTWRHLSNISSTSSKSWLAPMRRTAMDNYLAIGRAIADKDEASIKVLTTGDYTTKVNKIIRTRQPGQVWQWKVLSDVSDQALFQEKRLFRPLATSPRATVVSIRSGEIYMAKEPPKRGNRLVIHALVKFETNQELQVFTKQGQLVGAKTAEPHSVVEYLVLEKVGWYDNTWQVRDQIYK